MSALSHQGGADIRAILLRESCGGGCRNSSADENRSELANDWAQEPSLANISEDLKSVSAGIKGPRRASRPGLRTANSGPGRTARPAVAALPGVRGTKVSIRPGVTVRVAPAAAPAAEGLEGDPGGPQGVCPCVCVRERERGGERGEERRGERLKSRNEIIAARNPCAFARERARARASFEQKAPPHKQVENLSVRVHARTTRFLFLCIHICMYILCSRGDEKPGEG
jgi:hypothetical protein